MATYALPNDLQVRNAAIPQELKKARQWAIWKRADAKKNPCNLDGTWMTWSNENNKLTFEEVSRYPLVETFITLESGIIGVDIDGCIDSNGEIHPIVKSWLCRTYAEKSPSGTGIKMWIRGSIPNNKSFTDPKDSNGDATVIPWGDPKGHTGIEVYADKRPFTVTGNIIDGCPSEINEVPEVLHDILVRFGPAPKTRGKASPPPTTGIWDVDRWVYQYLEVVEKLADGYIVVCPWCAEHTTPGDTARIWTSPKYTFNCFHAHCSGRELERRSFEA